MSSGSSGATWSAGVRLYAGRVDPEWTVDDATASTQLAIWDGLPAIDHWPPPRSAVGYRGCWLRAPSGERWLAYDGFAVAEDGSSVAGRRDTARAFEAAVLRSAPPGLLPRGVVPPAQG